MGTSIRAPYQSPNRRRVLPMLGPQLPKLTDSLSDELIVAIIKRQIKQHAPTHTSIHGGSKIITLIMSSKRKDPAITKRNCLGVNKQISSDLIRQPNNPNANRTFRKFQNLPVMLLKVLNNLIQKVIDQFTWWPGLQLGDGPGLVPPEQCSSGGDAYPRWPLFIPPRLVHKHASRREPQRINWKVRHCH